jgi:chromosome segregation ATPase
METNELLTSLAKLESSLQEIESAKNQVQKTVESYAALQREIKTYTQSLDSIKTSISGILSDVRADKVDLENESAGILASFRESTTNALDDLKKDLSKANDAFKEKAQSISDTFKNNTDGELAKLRQSVQSLQECTTALEEIHTSIKNTLTEIGQVRQEISGLKGELESSQGAQDTILSEIKTNTGTLSVSLDSLKDDQKKAFSEVESHINDNSNKTHSLASSLTKRLKNSTILAIINLAMLIALGIMILLKF